MQQQRSEFTVADQYRYTRSSPVRWLVSHALRYRWILLVTIVGMLGMNAINSLITRIVGQAFDDILQTPPDRHGLTVVALTLIAIVILRGALDLLGSFSAETLAKRMERDSRDELYVSLLGKSQTFHNRQRVGDLMARAANDVRTLNDMINPGLALLIDSFTGLVVPIAFIAALDWRLLLTPLLFTAAFLVALRQYVRQLSPVSGRMRMQFGMMNAGLNEAVAG
ncbi:MAG: ABC transporter transmembrane domain-containing protein, partial [Thermomicrobiales bacterium]